MPVFYFKKLVDLWRSCERESTVTGAELTEFRNGRSFVVDLVEAGRHSDRWLPVDDGKL